MYPFKPFVLSILVLLTAVDANFLSRRTDGVTLALNRKMDSEGGMLSLVERDQARVRFLQNLSEMPAESGGTPFDVTNDAGIYTAQVGVGTPAINYTLAIDTGSAITFVGASKLYIPTHTSKDTGHNVSVDYGSGNFSGEEWTDTVTLAPNLVVENQSIGVANESYGFTGLDGILALGPTAQTYYMVNDTSLVPTVPDNLYREGKISEESIGIFFTPLSEPTTNGTLTFSGVDKSVLTSPVSYVSFTKNATMAKYYWAVDLSISYDDKQVLSTSVGVVDTGTTFILLPTDAYQKYKSVTGGVLDSQTGLLTITETQCQALKPLSFKIGNTTYDLSPNAQVWPRSFNSAIGGNATAIYLVITGAGTLKLDFAIIGYAFLERFYGVFDTTNQRMGFASTIYTNAITN